MSDAHMIMAKLSPIISRISMIESAITSSGGPVFKISRNPGGIVKMLDYAKNASDKTVQSRYHELLTCEHTVSLETLTEIGHQANSESQPGSSATKGRFYRGSKLADVSQDNTANTGKAPVAQSAAAIVDGQTALAIDSNEEPNPTPKTKTVKIVYRGKVSYKEVPL